MDLSVREAATLMGRSPRTVRSQVARGEIPGVKKNGRWRIERQHLRLTEAQHQALQGKAQDIRDAVDKALPSRVARHAGDRTKSIADLDAFRAGARVLQSVRACEVLEVPVEQRLRVAEKGRLRAVGRMVGGWQKHVALSTTPAREDCETTAITP